MRSLTSSHSYAQYTTQLQLFLHIFISDLHRLERLTCLVDRTKEITIEK